MNYYRLRFGEEASRKLSQLKGKTGLTPNILARIGFCMSINDPTHPIPRIIYLRVTVRLTAIH